MFFLATNHLYNTISFSELLGHWANTWRTWYTYIHTNRHNMHTCKINLFSLTCFVQDILSEQQESKTLGKDSPWQYVLRQSVTERPYGIRTVYVRHS